MLLSSQPFEEFSIAFITLVALIKFQDEKFKDEKEEIDYIFKMIDVNGSHFIEEQELLAFLRIIYGLGFYLTSEGKKDGEKIGEKIRVTAEEAAKGFMRESDKNHDGRLSRSEFMEFAQNRNFPGMLRNIRKDYVSSWIKIGMVIDFFQLILDIIKLFS